MGDKIPPVGQEQEKREDNSQTSILSQSAAEGGTLKRKTCTKASRSTVREMDKPETCSTSPTSSEDEVGPSKRSKDQPISAEDTEDVTRPVVAATSGEMPVGEQLDEQPTSSTTRVSDSSWITTSSDCNEAPSSSGLQNSEPKEDNVVLPETNDDSDEDMPPPLCSDLNPNFGTVHNRTSFPTGEGDRGRSAERSSSSSSTESDEEDEEEDEDEEMDEGGDYDHDVLLRRQTHSPDFLLDDFSTPSPQTSIPALLMWNDFPSPKIKSYPAMKQKLVANLDLIRRYGTYSTLKHHGGCVNSLGFNPTGRLLVSGSDDLNIAVWDWARKKVLLSFKSGHKSNVFQTKFLPLSNDSLIVSASRDGTIRLAELSEGCRKASTKAVCKHAGACHKIDVRSDAHHHVLSCGEDAAVFAIDIRDPAPTKLLTVFNDINRRVRLYSIMTNPLKATEFLVSGEDKYVRLYDIRKIKQEDIRSEPMRTLCPMPLRESAIPFSVTCAVFNHTGSEVLASYNDYNIFLMENSDTQDERAYIQEYEGHRNQQTIKGVNFFGPGSEYVVSGSDCGRVLFWDTATGQIVHHLMADDHGAVNVLEPHPSHAYLATSGLAKTIKLWAPNKEEPSSERDLEELKDAISEHQYNRRMDLRDAHNPTGMNSRFLMMLMQHVQQRQVNRPNQNGQAQPAQQQAAPAPANPDSDEPPPMDAGDGPCNTV